MYSFFCRILLLNFVLFASSCAILEQQAKNEELKKSVDDMRKLQADYYTRMDDLEQSFREFQGKFDEESHMRKAKLNALENQQKKILYVPSSIPSELFNYSVELADFSNVSQKTVVPSLDVEAVDEKNNLASILISLSKGNYKMAMSFINSDIESGLVEDSLMPCYLFWRGVSQINLSLNEQAIASLSDTYQKYPKSIFSPAALFFQAKAFANLGKRPEKDASLSKLRDDYPSSYYAHISKFREKIEN